jgi:hypothetical protein
MSDPDLKHSEEFVIMFCGYLTAELITLHAIEGTPDILDAWYRFKEMMGKKPDGTMVPEPPPQRLAKFPDHGHPRKPVKRL